MQGEGVLRLLESTYVIIIKHTGMHSCILLQNLLWESNLTRLDQVSELNDLTLLIINCDKNIKD